jgi:hypothetical protein
MPKKNYTYAAGMRQYEVGGLHGRFDRARETSPSSTGPKPPYADWLGSTFLTGFGNLSILSPQAQIERR